MRESGCPLCQQRLSVRWVDLAVAETDERFRIERCEGCGIGVTLPFPEDMDRYYTSDYHGGRHGLTAAMCDRRRRSIIDAVTGSLSERRLLDVGCGDGTFLQTAQLAGWQVWGVERFPGPARQLGLPVFNSLAEADAQGPYHCITLWHVLEHLPDLNDTIATLRRLLHDEGVLVIAVPDAASLQARCFGPSWLHLDVPRHLYHFSERALKLLLAQHEMIGRRLQRTELEYDMMGWAQSALNRLGGEPNLFFRLITGRKTQAGLLRRGLHCAAGGLLLGLSWLPAALSGWLGRGGTLIVAARKNALQVRTKVSVGR